MKVGITGTRFGMSETQRLRVYDLLNQIIEECKAQEIDPEFHHGDCVGVDVEAAIIAKTFGYKIVAHPGPVGELQAGHESDEIRPNFTHFKRNRNIVDETDFLIVVPLQNTHQSRGGTWYTHDYAIKQGKEMIVIYRD